jgi:NADH:ubiquinone oxidoreductase subunit 6 (subunit J)
MLLDDRDTSYRKRFSFTLVPGVAVTPLVALALLRLLGPVAPLATPDVPGAAYFGFVEFSTAFMQHYWLHFELATVLLLVGIVAAWTVIREER